MGMQMDQAHALVGLPWLGPEVCVVAEHWLVGVHAFGITLPKGAPNPHDVCCHHLEARCTLVPGQGLQWW